MNEHNNLNPYHLSYLNFLKLFAACVISFIYHYYYVFGKPFDNAMFNTFTWLGYGFVEFFFIVSGIIFYAIYYKKFMHHDLSYKDFFIRRSIKLLPVIMFTTFYLYISNWIFYISTGVSLRNRDGLDLILAVIFAGSGEPLFNKGIINGPLWFTTVLIICYIAGCLIMFINQKCKNSKFWLYIIPILLGLIAFIFIYTNVGASSKFLEIPRGFMTFFFGFYLGFVLEKFKFLKPKYKMIIRLILIVHLVFFLTLYMATDYLNFCKQNNLFGLFASIVLFPQFIVLFFDIYCLDKISNTRFIKFLAPLSFYFYVFNMPILITIKMVAISSSYTNLVMLFYINILIHIAISLIWWCLENTTKTALAKKYLWLKRYF